MEIRALYISLHLFGYHNHRYLTMHIYTLEPLQSRSFYKVIVEHIVSKVKSA